LLKERTDILKVIPDSSFFICFLDDIKMPTILKRIITFEYFRIVLCEKVKKELLRSLEFKKLFNDLNERFEGFEYSMYAEVLRPLFAREEIVKGEHEVIAAAYVHHYVLKQNYIVIIDDAGIRKFIQRNFPEMYKNIIGTLGFIKQSYKVFNIISRDEALNILDAIESSKFRVSKDVLEKIRNEILNEARR